MEDSIEEPRTFARFNGARWCLRGLARLGRERCRGRGRVEKKIARVQRKLSDIRFEEIDSSVLATRGSYASAMHTLMEGAALAVIVVFLFCGIGARP